MQEITCHISKQGHTTGDQDLSAHEYDTPEILFRGRQGLEAEAGMRLPAMVVGKSQGHSGRPGRYGGGTEFAETGTLEKKRGGMVRSVLNLTALCTLSEQKSIQLQCRELISVFSNSRMKGPRVGHGNSERGTLYLLDNVVRTASSIDSRRATTTRFCACRKGSNE